MVGTTPVARASTPVRSFMPARHENTPVAGNVQWDCVIVRSLTHCIARHRVSADSGPESSTHTRCVQGTQGGLEGSHDKTDKSGHPRGGVVGVSVACCGASDQREHCRRRQGHERRGASRSNGRSRKSGAHRESSYRGDGRTRRVQDRKPSAGHIFGDVLIVRVHDAQARRDPAHNGLHGNRERGHARRRGLRDDHGHRRDTRCGYPQRPHTNAVLT